MESITMQLAKEELNKYLDILGVRADISLGLFEDFGITLQVEDSVFDDAIAISVKNKKGYVAGSNERSVLMAVYRGQHFYGIVSEKSQKEIFKCRFNAALMVQ